MEKQHTSPFKQIVLVFRGIKALLLQKGPVFGWHQKCQMPQDISCWNASRLLRMRFFCCIQIHTALLLQNWITAPIREWPSFNNKCILQAGWSHLDVGLSYQATPIPKEGLLPGNKFHRCLYSKQHPGSLLWRFHNVYMWYARSYIWVVPFHWNFFTYEYPYQASDVRRAEISPPCVSLGRRVWMFVKYMDSSFVALHIFCREADLPALLLRCISTTIAH